MELRKGLRLFVDTAPIIYFIEEHPAYIDEVSDIFNKTAEERYRWLRQLLP